MPIESTCSPYLGISKITCKTIWIITWTSEWMNTNKYCSEDIIWFLFLFFFTEDKGDSDEDDEGLEDLSDLSDEDIDDLEKDDSGTICFCNELRLALFRVRYSLWLWNYKIFCICFQQFCLYVLTILTVGSMPLIFSLFSSLF